jgi:hypothetical protein
MYAFSTVITKTHEHACQMLFYFSDNLYIGNWLLREEPGFVLLND